jgi:hypothetical protein
MQGTKITAKDIFIYLGIFISLIVSVGNIIKIVFVAIDTKWKDAAAAVYNYDVYNDGVRFAIASLLVLYPLYVLFSWIASKDVKQNPEKKTSVVRKAFIYSAIFVTTCTIVGTLISVIYTFLGGELSIRFGFKALFILILSLVIGGYYYYLVKRDYTKETKAPAILTGVVSALVLLLVVWSIIIVGTPGEVRLKKIDDSRLEHLSSIQSEIFNRFQNTGKLPQTLSEIENAFQGFSVPVDPKTGEHYTYEVLKQGTIVKDSSGRQSLTSDASFKLCATFETVREYTVNGKQADERAMYSVSNYYYRGDISPFWNHGVGTTCFTRVITPDLYYGGR